MNQESYLDPCLINNISKLTHSECIDLIQKLKYDCEEMGLVLKEIPKEKSFQKNSLSNDSIIEISVLNLSNHFRNKFIFNSFIQQMCTEVLLYTMHCSRPSWDTAGNPMDRKSLPSCRLFEYMLINNLPHNLQLQFYFLNMCL